MDRGPTTPTSPGDRPRPRSRGFSFRSDKSGASGEGRSRYVESPKEKAGRDSIWKEKSKANPNAAINEAQPGTAHLIEQSTLANIRDYQHKDLNGNLIADPDRSNPTRPRMERPLDTIRSFERAIDDGYKRRNSYMRQDAESWDKDNNYASRRSSYFGGNENNRASQAYGGGGGGYYGHQSYNGYHGGNNRTRYGNNRMQSDPQIYGQRAYQQPQHGYHQSHDTVNTGITNGSDSTGPWANSTDPSSENSSIERTTMSKPTPPVDTYGIWNSNGHNDTIMEEQQAPPPPPPGPGAFAPFSAYMDNDYGGQQQQQQTQYGQRAGYNRPNGAPAVQPQQQPQYPQQTRQQQYGARQPQAMPPSGYQAGRLSKAPPNAYQPQVQPEEKRKSWLKRRFSKNN